MTINLGYIVEDCPRVTISGRLCSRMFFYKLLCDCHKFKKNIPYAETSLFFHFSLYTAELGLETARKNTMTRNKALTFICSKRLKAHKSSSWFSSNKTKKKKRNKKPTKQHHTLAASPKTNKPH